MDKRERNDIFRVLDEETLKNSKKDVRSRSFLFPKRILWTAGQVENSRRLLEKEEMQISLAAHEPCILKNEKGEDDYLEPDIVVVCDLDKLDEKGCHGAPDWVIEIVSPSSKKRDYLKKTAIYMEQGVREYWIVDPMREVTVVYKREEEGFPVIYKFGESVKAGIYEELEITIK